jgi:predicted HicB family RNase H-like nuclease
MKSLTFNGFEGSAEIDTDRQVCRGKLLFIPDLVTYEADSPKDLQVAFEDAVKDYLETCEELGREPHRPFRGSFNVRVKSELHRVAAVRAAHEDVSLNDLVVRSLECYLYGQGDVHNVTIRVENSASITSGSGSPTIWQPISARGAAHVQH